MNDSACANPGTQGQLPTMGGAFRCWRRVAESNGHPCGAPAFRAGRDPHPRALQTEWPRAEESNPHPEGAPVLETGGGPSARARGGAPGENRTHHELLCRQPLRQLASGAKWRGTRDSNPVMPGLESGALPIESCPPWCAPPDSNRHVSRV